MRYDGNGGCLGGCCGASRRSSSLVLSRQNLPFVSRSDAQIADIRRGGYVLRDVANPQIILIATGSEMDLALKGAEAMAAEGIAASVVSMPSTNVFDRQDKAYRESVLPRGVPRVAWKPV